MNIAFKRFIEFSQKENTTLDTILECVGDGLTIQDRDFKIIYQNKTIERLMGGHIGEFCYKAYQQRDSVCDDCQVQKVFFDGKTHTVEKTVPHGNGMIIVENTASPLKDDSGHIVGAMEVVRDITERKKLEVEIIKLNKNLEKRVQERTIELVELNTALKVLLQKREEDKHMIGENIFATYQSLIAPLAHQLRITLKDNFQIELLNIIDKTVKEAISPFSKKMSDPMVNLTPSEILVAGLVKEGKTTKEISRILNKSVRVVRSHRGNIREKFDIKNKKTNLRSYLLSIQ